MRVVHYLNQFFAGLGGEEAAGHEPVRMEGATGPGRGLAAAGLEVSTTLACGDDHFPVHEEEDLARLMSWLQEERPDVLVCGPAFGAGRYGYACGVLAREASRAGIRVVSGMHPENPGVLASEGGAYIVATTSNVAGMRDALPRMAAIARRLGEEEDPGSPDEAGYLPRGLRRNERAERSGADRVVDMLLAKLRGDPIETEALPAFDRVPPPPPVRAEEVTVALVSEAGCVPQGNPDGLVSRRARSWLRYPIEGVAGLGGGAYETVHGGFDTSAGNADPNRLVPLDAARTLESEGRIARLHDAFYTTTGVDTPVATAATFGQEIAQELHDAGVQAVVLTGT